MMSRRGARRVRRRRARPVLPPLARAQRARRGIKILQAADISVIATKGPSLDMSTAYGRAMAGLLGEFDTLEVEVKAERQQLAYAAQRDAGIRHGGPRHFGRPRRAGRDQVGG